MFTVLPEALPSLALHGIAELEPAVWRGEADTADRSFVAFGVPIGSTDFVRRRLGEHLQAEYCKSSRSCQICSSHILMFCASPRARHAIRTVAAAANDNAVCRTLQHLFAEPDAESQGWDAVEDSCRAQLPSMRPVSPRFGRRYKGPWQNYSSSVVPARSHVTCARRNCGLLVRLCDASGRVEPRGPQSKRSLCVVAGSAKPALALFFFFFRAPFDRRQVRDEGPCATAIYGLRGGFRAAGGLGRVPPCVGKELVQVGLWAISELSGGGELKERGREGALGCDSQEAGPARHPGGDGRRPQQARHGSGAMACKEAQELHGLGPKPAADLNPDDNEAAASGVASSGYV